MLIDFEFKNKMYNLFYYFGVLPFLSEDYNKNKVSRPRKCYLISLQVFSILGCCYEIPLRIRRTTKYLRMGGIFSTAGIISEMFLLLAINFSSTYKPVKNWRRLFRFINEDLQSYFEDKVSPRENLFGLYFTLTLLTCSMCFLITNDIMSTTPITDEIYFLGTRSSQVYVLFYVILLTDFVALFKKRFACLNDTLALLIVKRKELDEQKLRKEINGTIIIYRKISESVSHLNRIFGFFNLVSIFYLILKFVFWISMAIHSKNVGLHYYWVVIGYSIYNSVNKSK